MTTGHKIALGAAAAAAAVGLFFAMRPKGGRRPSPQNGGAVGPRLSGVPQQFLPTIAPAGSSGTSADVVNYTAAGANLANLASNLYNQYGGAMPDSSPPPELPAPDPYANQGATGAGDDSDLSSLNSGDGTELGGMGDS